MKKRIICLLAALLLLLGLSVSASAAVYANVIDTAELLSESEAEALDARCSELEQTYGCGVYLVTVDDYTAYYSADSIESFAESVFLDLGLGAGEEQDGVLLAGDLIGELISGDLHHHVPGLYSVSLVLDPLGDGPLLHGQAQLGHQYFISHLTRLLTCSARA